MVRSSWDGSGLLRGSRAPEMVGSSWDGWERLRVSRAPEMVGFGK